MIFIYKNHGDRHLHDQQTAYCVLATRAGAISPRKRLPPPQSSQIKTRSFLFITVFVVGSVFPHSVSLSVSQCCNVTYGGGIFGKVL